MHLQDVSAVRYKFIADFTKTTTLPDLWEGFMAGRSMFYRFSNLFLFIIGLLLIRQTAWASPDQLHAVPDASAYVLAPMGIAAVLMAEKRRRRLAKLRHGVGIAYFIVKRCVDIILSAGMLAVLSPVFGIISLLVWIDSPGPIIFKRRVIGRNGVSFDMYKFRSMVENADHILEHNDELRRAFSQNFKLIKDPRVTRLGKFLRKTSLDELPQLVNILLGTMTFVGPRPIHADEVGIYGPAVERFKTVTPGITGLWQTSGRSETSYECRVKMDMRYIDSRSILFDLWIIACTLPAVLLRRGAC